MKLKLHESIRQGDVLVTRCDKVAKTTELPREGGRVVLAHGEVTGHAHAISDPGVCMLRAEGIHDRVLRVVDDLVSLDHEEHSSFALHQGEYTVRIQREWDGELSQKVED